MIRRLYIENYALIGRADITLHPGFSVITGETGAGKSILLGALGLLRGQRADTKAIKAGERRCVVEATFEVGGYGLEPFFATHELDFDGDECILRRELTAAGKSRAFINDTPVALSQLKELGDRLVDIHSQHQNLLLGKDDFQLNVVDTLAGDTDSLSRYRDTYRQWRAAQQALDEAVARAARNRADEDYLRFQFQQLDEARLHEGEQAELEAEVEMLEHAEDIKQELYRASQAVEQQGDADTDILALMKQAAAALRNIDRRFPPAGELAQRIESCYIEMKDIAAELEAEAEGVAYNPARLEQLHDRLDTIYALEQKHRVDSVEALLHIAAELDQRLASIDTDDDRVAQLRQRSEQLLQQARQQATTLSARRAQCAKRIERQMEESLRPLGMPNVTFRVAVESHPDHLTPTGADKVAFLFSANKNGVLQQVAQVASGGEIARVMLALKALIATAAKQPTIIFDEIDTGVSGGMAEKMARIMQQMGNAGTQVVSITHLPQIAALGSHHYRVYKQDEGETTATHIDLLTPQERVEEMAHLLSGETLTEAAIENARALLNQAI